jgi:hypothetical protein
MGQYWHPVNLDKREFINPHRLGTGLKLWEQIANHPSTGAALIILCAAMPEPRGGGDFDLDANWHGPERTFPEHNASPAPMPDEYPAIAQRTIGRWAGDRIALIGDYAQDGDLPLATRRDGDVPASQIYNLCDEIGESTWRDVSDDVAAVLEHELGGTFSAGPGWRTWRTAPDPTT